MHVPATPLPLFSHAETRLGILRCHLVYIRILSSTLTHHWTFIPEVSRFATVVTHLLPHSRVSPALHIQRPIVVSIGYFLSLLCPSVVLVHQPLHDELQRLVGVVWTAHQGHHQSVVRLRYTIATCSESSILCPAQDSRSNRPPMENRSSRRHCSRFVVLL